MLNHKEIPAKIQQMRTTVLNEGKAGKVIDPKIIKPAPWCRTAASPIEEAGSSSSRGDMAIGAKTDIWGAVTPEQKPLLPCKAEKQKDDNDPKRRRTSAPATIRPRGKPSVVVFPGEEIQFPEEVDPAFGRTEINQTLFKEWQLYYERLVQGGNHLTEADCTLLLAEKHKLLDDAQAELERRKEMAAFASAHPMPRPVGAPKESVRNDPIGCKTAAGKKKEAKND